MSAETEPQERTRALLEASAQDVRRGAGLSLAASPTTWAVLGFIAVCWVHLWRIGSGGVISDEIRYQSAAIQYARGNFSPNLQHPPLAKELMALADKLFGPSWAAARISGALAGVATAALIYVWACRAGGRWAGVAGLGLWGLVPQRAGVPGLMQLGISTRIDRFALLDPVATMFVALALFAGWQWMTERALPWAILAGFATGLAAASKAPAILVGPVIVGFSLWSGRRSVGRFLRQLAAHVGAGIMAVAVVYTPLGLHGAFHQLHYMFVFQLQHGERGHPVYLAGKTYFHAPWWAGVYHQTVGYGPVVTVVGALLIAAALYAHRPLSTPVYALTAALVIYVGLTLTGLQLPFYYVLWQPGLVFAAALGVGALLRLGHGRLAVLGACAALAAPVVALGVAVARVGPGAYEQAARLTICRRQCVAKVVGNGDVLHTYLRGRWVVQSLRVGSKLPDLVVADPTITRRKPETAATVNAWRVEADQLGYDHKMVDGLEVWVSPTGPPG